MWSVNLTGFLVSKITYQMSSYVTLEGERVNSYSTTFYALNVA